MHARVFELVLIGLVLVVIILAVTVGAFASVWLGMLLGAVLVVGLVSLIYNFDYWLVRHLLNANDRLMFDLCEHGFVGAVRRVAGKLPADPRCRFCLIPFRGIGGILQIRRSAKNPNFCRSCFEALPTRTYDLEAGVLFADIRGYTSWTETHPPEDAVEALSQFYAIANRVLAMDDAIMEFVGDQVMAIYPALMPSHGERTPDVMLAAAKRLIKEISNDKDALPVGVGLNVGVCRVGSVVKGDTKDFTAIGDVVNTAARLQSNAQSYQIVVSESVYMGLRERDPQAEPITLEVKGKRDPIVAYAISP